MEIKLNYLNKTKHQTESVWLAFCVSSHPTHYAAEYYSTKNDRKIQILCHFRFYISAWMEFMCLVLFSNIVTHMRTGLIYLFKKLRSRFKKALSSIIGLVLKEKENRKEREKRREEKTGTEPFKLTKHHGVYYFLLSTQCICELLLHLWYPVSTYWTYC